MIGLGSRVGLLTVAEPTGQRKAGYMVWWVQDFCKAGTEGYFRDAIWKADSDPSHRGAQQQGQHHMDLPL